MFVLDHGWLVPLLPAVAFWVILFFGKKMPRGGAEVGIASILIACLLSLIALAGWIGRPTVEPAVHEATASHSVEADSHSEAGAAPTDSAATGEAAAEVEHHLIRESIEHRTQWFSLGGVGIDIGIHMDGLAVILLCVVAIISSLVHIFSLEYVRGDVRFTHYYAALSLFTCGMFVLVTASETLQMLFGWELMGLCSFMLIGHWWEEKKNSDAALKAFLTTRTGDVGLLVGLSILFFSNDMSFNIAKLNAAALNGDINRAALVAGAVALLVAVIGKSAQFPLHTWLPDAMAGPTPVSSLIHAATMVVAGVYLVARLYGVFWAAFDIGTVGHNPYNVVAVVGAITIVIAAALAFVQDDIKKVLAYSTISQLGYMIMGLGVGAWTGAMFHLFTHAFFKCCLFLGAGSVSHSGAHHSFDMKKDMGGLRKYMPVTFTTFVISSLALAGIFPLAGFWSKDEILLGAGKNGYEMFMIVGAVGGLLTAAYMTRCVWLTFFGDYRGHHHPHESPKLITVPLIILTVFSVGAGFLNAPGILAFGKWTLNENLVMAGVPEHSFQVGVGLLSTLLGLLGIAIGIAYWKFEMGPHGLTKKNPLARSGLSLLENRYYLDHLYTDGVVGSIKGPIAAAAYWFNQNVLDGVVNGVGRGAVRTSQFVYETIDQGVVDGAVRGTGAAASGGGEVLRGMQSGRVQNYAALMFGAVVLLALALVTLV